MTSFMKFTLGALVVAVIGIIVVTVAIGAKVREETVVERPYEEGLRLGADKKARADLKLTLALDDEAPAAGLSPLALRIADRDGRPLQGARVTVLLSRPDTGHGEVRGEAREVGPGRCEAALAFPAEGPWDVRADVERGGDRVRLERRVVAEPACDLGAGPCTARLEGGDEVTLALEPRPLRTMRDLSVRAWVKGPTAPRPGARSADPAVKVSVSFSMPGMEMGENRVTLSPSGEGLTGRAVLVRCPSGRNDFVADVSVRGPGELVRGARFRLSAEQ